MIRPYRPGDTDELLEVWEAASKLAHPFLSRGFMQRERKAIRDQHLHVAETWVYEADRHVIGFVALVGDEIGALFVHPDHHGEGLGRALVDHARTRRDRLEVEVFRDNPIGRRFYDRYGFRPIGEHLHEPSGHMVLRLRLPEK